MMKNLLSVGVNANNMGIRNNNIMRNDNVIHCLENLNNLYPQSLGFVIGKIGVLQGLQGISSCAL